MDTTWFLKRSIQLPTQKSFSRIYYGITQEENVKMGFPGAKRMYEAFEKHGSDKQAVVFAYEDICQKLMAEWLKKDAQEKQYY